MGQSTRVKFRVNWPVPTTSPIGGVASSLNMNPASGAFPALNYIAQCYNNYRFENVKFHYTSAMGYNTNGIMHSCFVNNPEVMGKLTIGSVSNVSTLIMNSSTTVTSHVTDPHIVPDTLPNRRRWYSTDSCLNLSADDSMYNTWDRSMQSQFNVMILGGPASVSVGYYTISGWCVFEGLSPINLAIGCDTLLKDKTPISFPHPDGSVTVYDPATGVSVTYPAPLGITSTLPTVSQAMEVDAPDTA